MAMLEISGLSKRFGGLQAVDDVGFSMKQGQILGIIGPNGAGKSTLFNLITACLVPDTGEVLLNGESITGLQPHDIVHKGLGRTFQDATLFPKSTALENVMNAHFGQIAPTFPGTLWRSFCRPGIFAEQSQTAMRILEFVGLESYRDHMACNLDHGRQGLLQLAIALATGPKILMVDEPLRGMNPTEKDEVTDLLLKVRESGISVIIIEHDVKSIMKVCDRIVVINYGKKIAEGTPDEIKSDERVIEAYLGSDEIA